MNKTILYVLILTNGIVSTSHAAEETWIKKADMPTATSFHSASVVDGKIYVIGGTDNLNSWAYWSTMLMYDPATDTWTRKADMPTARARLSATAVNGRIYAIGGSPHRDADIAAVEVYDPATDTWTTKADMPRARNWHSSSVVNGKIYVIGGKIYPSEAIVSTVEEYDPVTDTWTRKTDMPGPRGIHSASVVDGKIYVIGGVTGTFGPFVSTVEAYDPATDTWTRKANMPTARASHSASVVCGKIYAVGGASGWVPCVSTMDVYDPGTDTWTKGADMPTARGCHSASVVDGKIYAIGGFLNPSSWASTAAVEVYDPGLITPPPDFNGNGIVDSEDICMMIDFWGTDEPLYDIAPPPFGDGIVDVQDLVLVAEHLFEEIYPPELIAYWKLDEREGDIAKDNAGDNPGVVYGDAIWQSDGGVKAGALLLDGVDDYIITNFVLDPANGPFSVFAWLKGGTAGDAIISQLDGIGGSGETWLGIEPASGSFMTGLVAPPVGRFIPKPLVSESIITDGQWYHVGFVWDGSYRILYMAGTEVTKDAAAQNPLKSATGGLHIGVDKNLGTDIFFSGLIDDVRIYNKALSAEEIAALVE